MAEKKVALRQAQGKKVAPKKPEVKTQAKKTVAKAPVVEKKIAEKAPKVEKVEVVKTSKEVKAEASKVSDWITTSSKEDLIKEFATKDGDTGSPEVQVALATHKILNLTLHLEQNPKDNHSRRGLLKVISKRRRIVNYLAEKDSDRYKDLIKKVNLSK